MKYAALFLALSLFSACADADVEQLMEGYLWEKRVLLIFSPTTDHSHALAQNATLASLGEGVRERDITVWRFVHMEQVSADNKRMSHLGTPAFYNYFDVPTHAFTVILLGKDGGEKLRETSAVSADKLVSLIDAMPMRQREMRKP